MPQSTLNSYQRSELAYKDPEVLRELYWEQMLTLAEIADELNVNRSTIQYWMDKRDVERRPPGNAGHPRVHIRTQKTGYVQMFDDCNGVQSTAYVHQLVAIADGADPYDIFSDGERQVHHVNGLKWDNRPSNLMVVTPREHSQIEARARENAQRSRTIRGEFM